LAAGSSWPCDFGPDLSRGFRALKTWFTLKVYGSDALGAVISRTCKLARHLERRIAETPELELLAPVELNIVCFRYRAEKPDPLNQQIVIELQESGIVAPLRPRSAAAWRYERPSSTTAPVVLTSTSWWTVRSPTVALCRTAPPKPRPVNLLKNSMPTRFCNHDW